MTVSDQDATLTAIWLPQSQADSDATRWITELVGERRPIRARGIEADGMDLVLLRNATGQVEPLPEAGADGVEVVPYRMRYPADLGQQERLDQAPYLFSVRVFAPPQWQQPIRDWLDQEHFERQTAMKGVFYSEGYEPLEGTFHFFNLWAIAHPDLIDSPEWIRVRDSSWYENVREGFQASTVRREIYRILGPES